MRVDTYNRQISLGWARALLNSIRAEHAYGSEGYWMLHRVSLYISDELVTVRTEDRIEREVRG